MAGQTRRAFLEGGALWVLAAGGTTALAGQEKKPVARLAMVTDVHYADAPERGTRFYRESLGKMREAVEGLNRLPLDGAIELGDFIDAPAKADPNAEEGFLKTVNREFAKLKAPRHYVLGNHCVSALSKARFLGAVEREKSFYSFDAGGVHVILLDACYRKDGAAYDAGNFTWTDTEIPPAQREWLAADLKKTLKKTVVVVHQRLDLPVGDNYAIHSSPEVRRILEESGKVAGVVMGHSHKNEYREIGGIPYLVLAAMVEGSGAENSGYSHLEVYADGSLRLNGFRKHGKHPFLDRVKPAG